MFPFIPEQSPQKRLRETALNLSGWRERGFYGRSYRVKDNLTADDLRKRLHITLNHEVEVLEHQFSRNQVNTITGTASFLDKNTIQVVGEEGEISSFKGKELSFGGWNRTLSSRLYSVQ